MAILHRLKAIWLKALKWVVAVAIAAAITALVTNLIGEVLDGDNRPTSTEPQPDIRSEVDGANGAEVDRNCADFSTQAEAQAFFLAHGGSEGDPHRLDADDDGDVCESLP